MVMLFMVNDWCGHMDADQPCLCQLEILTDNGLNKWLLFSSLNKKSGARQLLCWFRNLMLSQLISLGFSWPHYCKMAATTSGIISTFKTWKRVGKVPATNFLLLGKQNHSQQPSKDFLVSLV